MALFRRKRDSEEDRSIDPYSLAQYINDFFTYNGSNYPLYGFGPHTSDREDISSSFEGFVQSAYRSDGVIFACMLARLSVFSDVRFQYRELRNGTPGDMMGNPDGRNPASRGLAKLRNPWPGATTGDLLARMIQDVDLAGNAFVVDLGDQLARLRPDWVTIVAETPGESSLWHPEARVAGYLYKPGGTGSDEAPIAYLREQVAHYAPTPDPSSRFRGMSWLEAVRTEIQSDKAASEHKLQFFTNGATVNLILEYPPEVKKELFQMAVKSFQDQHEGVRNAYKTLHLLAATAKPVGTDMQQMDFKAVQGAGETRIAAAAGVPPIIVGLSEGLQAATYSNYGQARRAFADRTIRPLWRNACGSLANIIPSPPNAELWYDDTDVAFLREDQKDAADIRQIDAITIKTLVDAGFTPESAADAVCAGDMKRLDHSGLVSVQLQKPGTETPPQKMQLVPDGNSAPVVNINSPRMRRTLLRDENGKLTGFQDEEAE